MGRAQQEEKEEEEDAEEEEEEKEEVDTAGSDYLLLARIRALSYWHTYLPGMVYDALLRCCVLLRTIAVAQAAAISSNARGENMIKRGSAFSQTYIRQ